MMGSRIVVIIPARDEEASIGAVVRGLPPSVGEVIVVDNGSRDRTAAVAGAAGARVVQEPQRGYGQACLTGIAAARDADLLVFMDGDGSDDPAQLERVTAPILEGRAERFVIGSRSLGRREAGAHPWHAVFGTKLCVGLMNLLTGRVPATSARSGRSRRPRCDGSACATVTTDGPSRCRSRPRARACGWSKYPSTTGHAAPATAR